MLKLMGSVDQTLLKGKQLWLSGWATLDDKGFQGPFHLEINGKPSAFEYRVKGRPDVAKAYGPAALESGFEIQASEKFSPFNFPRDIKLIVDGQPLMIHPKALAHNFKGVLSDQAQFWRHIQNPGSRIKDPDTLQFLATRSLASFRRQPAIQASALCVLVWQDLLKEGKERYSQNYPRFGAFLMRRLKDQPDDLSRRWYVSLANALAFYCIKYGDDASAMSLFKAIIEKTADIKDTWLCVPNGVSARFMLGLMALRKKDLKASTQFMQQSFAFFADRTKFFKVDNTWSFDELLEVSRLAQQAFTVHELIETKGQSGRLNPGADLDMSRISTQLIALFRNRKILEDLKVLPLLNEEKKAYS